MPNPHPTPGAPVTQPLPTPKHHNPPRTKTLPKRKFPWGRAVKVGLMSLRADCPKSGKGLVKRKPLNIESKERVRLPAYDKCQGTGKPIYTYHKRRRKIGVFRSSKLYKTYNGAKPPPRSLWDQKEFREWLEKRGFELDKGAIEIESKKRTYALDGFPGSLPTGDDWKDLGEDIVKAGGRCAYTIWEIGKRRKCRCPDGGPCVTRKGKPMT